MKKNYWVLLWAVIIDLSLPVLVTAADETISGNLTVTGNVVANGTVDSDSNVLSFGTQGANPGVGLIYQDNSADTLTFYTQRNPASWLWLHNAVASGTVPAMRLDATHKLSLYRADGTTVGAGLDPVSSILSLGSATLYRDSEGALKTDGAFAVGGNFRAPSITNVDGVMTGGASGLTFNAGGTDQSIVLNPTGSGALVVNGPVRAMGGLATPALSFVGDADSGIFSAGDGQLGLSSNAVRVLTVDRTAEGVSRITANGGLNINAEGAMALNAGGDDQSVTLTPSGAGQVVVASGKNLRLGGNGGGTPSGLLLTRSDAGTPAWMGTVADTNSLSFGSGSTVGSSPRVVLDLTTGNVGVGTSAPAAKLDVTGELRVTGTGSTIIKGPVLLVPQGDLSMGEFTAGANPANL